MPLQARAELISVKKQATPLGWWRAVEGFPAAALASQRGVPMRRPNQPRLGAHYSAGSAAQRSAAYWINAWILQACWEAGVDREGITGGMGCSVHNKG